jgi:hypothetical protein
MRRENDSNVFYFLTWVLRKSGFDIAPNSFHKLWVDRPTVDDTPIDTRPRAFQPFSTSEQFID